MNCASFRFAPSAPIPLSHSSSVTSPSAAPCASRYSKNESIVCEATAERYSAMEIEPFPVLSICWKTWTRRERRAGDIMSTPIVR